MEVFKAKHSDEIQKALKKRRAEYRMNWLNKKKATEAKPADESLKCDS